MSEDYMTAISKMTEKESKQWLVKLADTVYQSRGNYAYETREERLSRAETIVGDMSVSKLDIFNK